MDPINGESLREVIRQAKAARKKPGMNAMMNETQRMNADQAIVIGAATKLALRECVDDPWLATMALAWWLNATYPASMVATALASVLIELEALGDVGSGRLDEHA